MITLLILSFHVDVLDRSKCGKGVMVSTCVFTICAVGTVYFAVGTVYFATRRVWAAALEAGRDLAGRERRQQGRMLVEPELGCSGTDAAAGSLPWQRGWRLLRRAGRAEMEPGLQSDGKKEVPPGRDTV